MSNNSWRYYKSFEDDVRVLSKYIELNESNFKVYSIELVRLYLSICSEIDVTLKEICSSIESKKKPKNIHEYFEILEPEMNRFKKDVSIVEFSLNFSPWKNWERKDPPNWWSKYNGVKHQRNIKYEDANLGNVLKALCALFIVKCVFFVFEKIDSEHGNDIFADDYIKRIVSKEDLVRWDNPLFYFRD